MNYHPSNLYKYIQKSELRIINDNFRIRLSSELAEKYDTGLYDLALDRIAENINEIKALNIQYPGKAKPIFYMYIVPDEDFIDLLSFPFPDAKSGGRPVSTFDLDGFNSAYGQSQNSLEFPRKEETIAHKVNMIHEFAHLVNDMFFNKDRLLSEGFAETLPLYTLGYEEKFDEHREIIKQLKPDDIISPEQLLKMGKDNTFGRTTRIANKTCSFDLSYISSYLFIRGYITRIAEAFKFNRAEATQKFLEFGRASQCTNEWLLLDLASYIGIDEAKILSGKDLQLLAQSDIKKI